MSVGFNSQADRLQSSAPPAGSGAFTAIGFLYIATDRNDYTTVIAFEGTGGVFRLLETDADGTTLTVFDSALGDMFSTRPSLTTGTWYAIALRYDSSRNGTLDVLPIGGSKSTYSSNNPASNHTFTTVTLAANVNFSSEFLNGRLRSWRIWDARLSDAEVDAEFGSLTAVLTTNLRSEYRLPDSTNRLTDSSGNSRTLTNPGSSGSWTDESDPSISSAVTGTVAVTSTIATLVASGSPVDVGTVAVTSTNATLVVSGSPAEAGPVAVTSTIATLVASGSPVDVGTFGVTTTVPTLDADGSPVAGVDGAFVATTTLPSVVAAGWPSVQASFAVTTEVPALDADAILGIDGSYAVTTAVPTLDAAGVLGLSGTVAVTSSVATLVAAGTASLTGVVSVTTAVPSITQRARGLGFNAYGDGLVHAAAPNNNLYTARLWVRMAQSSNGGAQMSPFSMEDTAQPEHTIQSIFTRLSPNLGQYELHEDRDVGGIGGFLFTSTIGVNVWVYLCIAQNIAANRTRLYWRRENDANVQYDEWAGLSSYGTAINRVLVGTCDASDQNEFFIGGIAAVAIWSGRELSEAEIQADSLILHPQDTDNLWSYWALQSAATRLTDASGNGRSLTDIGAGSWTELSDGPQVTVGTPPNSGAFVVTTSPLPTLAAVGTPIVRGTATVTATRPTLSASGYGQTGFGAVRLLPQGDSITDGPNGSYRDILHRRLTAAGFTVDFVGHRVDQYPSSGQPDLDHSGTPGYTIANIQSEWPTHYSAYNPNATIVMAGTNDMAWWTALPGDATFAADAQPASCHAQVLDRFITVIRASNPDILVFVCTIAPMSSSTIGPNGWDRADLAVAFNSAIRTKVVPPRQAAGQRVYLLDANAQLTLGSLYDGIHPTKAALDGVAEYMAPIIVNALNSVAPSLPVGGIGATTPIPALAAVGLGDPPSAISGTFSVTTPGATVAAYDVPVAAGAVPSILPAQLLIGFFEEAQDDWMTTTGRDWDVRYRYLTYRWADNWGFGALDGSFAYEFLTETHAQGYTPCVTYYAMHEMASSTGRVGWEADWLNKLQTPGIMAEYFTHVRILMQRCLQLGQPVFIHVEPDGLGFLQQQTGNDPQVYAAIAASGLSELASLPNTVAGWGQAWLAMREAVGATNVILGTHVSGWASGLDIIHFNVNEPLQTHVDTVYNFMAPTGILPNVTGVTYDVLVGDPLDRDADYYQLVRAENRWWDDSASAPINSRSFNRYAEWARLWNIKAGLRWVMWQIPCGTSVQRNVPYDGTQGSGYRDNRSEYFFGASGQTNRQKWIDAGVIALLFGHGQGEQTHPWVDYGYLRDNAVLGHAVPRGTGEGGDPVDDPVVGTLGRTTSVPTMLGVGTPVLHVGTSNLTTAVPTVVASGVPAVNGTVAAIAPIGSVSGSGTTSVLGDGDATLALPTLGAVGTPVHQGSVAVTTTAPLIYLGGSPDGSIAGTCAVTATVPSLAASGTPTVRGTFAITTSTASMAAAGVVGESATVSVTTSTPTLVAVGSVTLSSEGTVSVTSPLPTLATTGRGVTIRRIAFAKYNQAVRVMARRTRTGEGNGDLDG